MHVDGYLRFKKIHAAGFDGKLILNANDAKNISYNVWEEKIKLLPVSSYQVEATFVQITFEILYERIVKTAIATLCYTDTCFIAKSSYLTYVVTRLSGYSYV